MEMIKEYKMREKQANQGLIMGTLFIIAFFVFMAIFQRAMLMFLIFGALQLIMGAINKNSKVVILFSQYIEIKLGPLASKKMIKYDSIQSVIMEKKKMIIHYTNENKESKKAKIHALALEKEDMSDLHTFLKTKAESSNNSDIQLNDHKPIEPTA